MATPFVGEIRMFGGNFAPAGWMFCEGQILPISENQVLFQLIGTTYGGDGVNTFALPDLRGRVPLHAGNAFVQGQSGGAETVTLTTSQIPAHTHSFLASSDNAQGTAQARVLATTPDYTPYVAGSATSAMSPSSIGSVGGSQPHSNFQPYLCIDFIISLFGIFPSQN
jgi:microcystin-dependent protein